MLLAALPPRAKGCLRQLPRLLLPPAAVKQHPGEQEGEPGPSTKPRGERVHGAPGAARTYRGYFAVHGPGSGLGWAQSCGTAMPAARCRAEPARRGRGRRCLASGLVRQCQRQEQTCRTCRPAPAPPVSQLLQAQPAKHLPCAAGLGMRGRARGARGICEQGRPGPREQQHAGIPCCSSGCLPTQAPLPPLCAPHSRTHSSPAQPSTEEGMHSHGQPQGSLSGVTQKSGVPCSKGKKMLFPPNFSGGLFIPLLTELLC